MKKQVRSQNGHAEGVLEGSGATFGPFWRLWGPFWGALGRPGEAFGTTFGHAKFGPNFGTNLDALLVVSWWASAGCAKPNMHSLGGTDRVWRDWSSTPAPCRGVCKQG